jgi:hypothetical protein
VLNGPEAMNAAETRVEILDAEGEVIETFSGVKQLVARGIAATIQRRLISSR